jgi:Protein O-mannosyl-transferase TMEM260-like
VPYADGPLTWTAAVVTLVAFGVYLRTMLPADGFWDIGEAQTVPHTLSIFHPTGFPTYAILGWLWSQLPVGGVAWRMNLLSGVCLALAAGLVVLITGHLIDERHPGIRAGAAAVAGGTFAFASESWALAVAADVHALNAFFVALILWLLLCWRAAEWGGAHQPGRWLLAAAGVFGVALGNHPVVGLLAFGIFIWLFVVDPRIWRRPKLIAGCVGMVALGLTTYLYIPVRALTPPEPPLFYARPTTLARMRYLIFAEQFHNLFDFSTFLQNFGSRWASAAPILVRQYVGPGWVVVALGAATLAVRQVGAFVFLGLVVLADVVYSMNFNDGDIARYYLATIAATAPLIGVAVAMTAAYSARAAADMSRRIAGSLGRRRIARAVGAGVITVSLLLPLATLVGNYDTADQSTNHEADLWVASVYRALPPNAVIISWWSYSTPLWYHRWVLGQRPDVTIIDERNILDDGYGTIDGAIRAFLGARPVYVVPANWEVEHVMTSYETETIQTYSLYPALLRIEAYYP